jgi:hypothetical protein
LIAAKGRLPSPTWLPLGFGLRHRFSAPPMSLVIVTRTQDLYSPRKSRIANWGVVAALAWIHATAKETQK